MLSKLRKTLDKREVRGLNDRVRQLVQADRVEEALPLAEKAYQLAAKRLDSNDAEYVLAFSRLASVLHYAASERGRAEQLLTQIFPHAEAALGSTDAEFIAILNNLSVLYQCNGRPDLAVPMMRRVVEAKRKLYGAGSTAYAENMQDLVLMLEEMGRVAETEPYVRELALMVGRRLGEASPEYVMAIENLARACFFAGKELEAEELQRKIELIKRGPSREEQLVEQAKQAYEDGDFATARKLHRHILATLPTLPLPPMMLELMGNAFDPLLSYASELDKEGVAAENAGDYETASHAYRQVVEIARISHGEQHPTVAFALSNLALVQQKQGLFDEAKNLHVEAVALLDHPAIKSEEREKILVNITSLFREICDREAPAPNEKFEESIETLKGRPEDYARSFRLRFPVPVEGEDPVQSAWRWMVARAVYYQSFGDHRRARLLYETALEMMRLVFGKEPRKLLAPIEELARHCISHADFDVADSLLEEAAEIAADIYGPDSHERARVYRDRGHLLTALANFPDAEEALLTAREIVAGIFGEEHANTALLDDDLIVVRLRMGRSDEVREWLRSRAARFDERGAESFDDEEAQRIATFLFELGEYARAEELFRRVLKKQEAAIGEWDPRYALTLSNTGNLYRLTGRFQEAAQCFRQAANIRQAEFGPDHTSVASSRLRLALSLAAVGQPEEALREVQEVLRIGDRLIADVSAISSQQQLFRLLRQQKDDLDVGLSLVWQFFGDRADLVRTVYEMVLRRKGLSAEALAARRLPILSGRYPHLRDKLEELNHLTTLITQARLASTNVSQDEIERAVERKERLEAELARAIREMRLDQRLSDATLERVVQCLPDGTALVEYVRLAPYNFSAVLSGPDPEHLPARYLAFVLHAGRDKEVRLLDLGLAEDVEQDLLSLGERVAGRARNLVPFKREKSAEFYLSAGASIRERILDPIVPLLEDKKDLFIVPDGSLFLLPFDILPLDSTRFVIDEFRLSFLGAARDVLRFEERADVQLNAPAIVAGPNFNLHLPHNSVVNEGLSEAGNVSNRSLKNLGLHFQPLPGAAAEGLEVSKLLKEPLLLCGADAVESEVRRLKSPAFLHLATHGFFLPEQTDGTNFEAQTDAAMITSGLALAGANAWLRGLALPEELEDGILTAEDVATLNLFETDLAVLSACSSGVGDVVAGEGVFGLRRAFFAAGVRTVIMSLWKVPDDETKDLMLHFYQALQRGAPKSQALREAKLAIRELHPHPFYWGSFICEGDWMPAHKEAFDNR
jgi:CHAT domain-containing protein/tetratricopeptide (TPR) repeat protein